MKQRPCWSTSYATYENQSFITVFAQALDPILSQMNPVHTFIPYFFYHPISHTNKDEAPVNARKTKGVGWNKDPLILNLGNRRVVVSFECRSLHARTGALSTHWWAEKPMDTLEETKKLACLCRVIEQQFQSHSRCKPLTRTATQSALALMLIHILKICSVSTQRSA